MALTDSLFAYYELDEATGVTRVDATGRGNDLASNGSGGGVAQVAGVNGGLGAGFTSGNGQFLSHASNSDLQWGNRDRAITGWFKLTNKSATHMLVTKEAPGGGNREFELGYDQGIDRFSLNVFAAVDSSQVVVANEYGSPAAGVYHFIAFWYDATAHTINLQINNGPIDTLAGAAALQTAGSAPFEIGGRGYNDVFFSGAADKVTVYNRKLTASELTQLFNCGAPPAYPLTVIPALPSRGGLLAYQGDSLTIGQGSTGTGDYPTQVSQGMTAYGAYGKRVYGASGQTLVNMIANASVGIDPYYRAANAQNVLCVWGGTNDLYGGASAATTITNLTTYLAARRAAGWKTVILTILPRSNVGTPGSFEADRQTVNTWIRANSALYDALADVAANATIGVAGAETNATYYVDLVHLTNAGYAIVAGIVQAAILGLPLIYSQVLSGSLSFTGGLSRSTSKTLGGSLSFTGGLSKRVSKILSGSLSFTGGISRQTNKILSGVLSFVGGLISTPKSKMDVTVSDAAVTTCTVEDSTL